MLDTTTATVGEVELCYQVRGTGVPLLLVMGLGSQMIVWPEGFCDALVRRGFCVARFDNRDVGGSTRFRDRGVPSLRRSMLRWAAGRPVPAPYSLRDLAADALGLLDVLGWDDAHVVGASMGGMIAQRMAIDRPARVRSLTSIMSHPGDRISMLPRPRAMAALLGPAPRTAEQAGDAWVKMFRAIGGPGFTYDEAGVRALGRLHFERGPSGSGFLRQLTAILAAPDRRAALARLTMPALVVHGTADPLVRPRGGEQTAAAIPGATLLRIEGMGHDLPAGAWPRMCDAIEAVAARADGG